MAILKFCLRIFPSIALLVSRSVENVNVMIESVLSKQLLDNAMQSSPLHGLVFFVLLFISM